MRQNKIVDVEVDRWLTETPQALLLVINGKRVWLPKSQVEFNEEDGTVSMPEYYAIDKELI